MKKYQSWFVPISLFLSVFLAFNMRKFTSGLSADSSFLKSTEWGIGILQDIGVLALELVRILVVPLIMTSCAIGLRRFREEGGLLKASVKTVVVYISMYALAILLACFMVHFLKPGVVVEGEKELDRGQMITNLFEASEEIRGVSEVNSDSFWDEEMEMLIGGESKILLLNNLLRNPLFILTAGTVLLSFGSFLLPKRVESILYETLITINKFVYYCVNKMILALPLVIFALIFPVVYENSFSTFSQFWKLFAVTVFTLFVYLVVVQPIFYSLFLRRSPILHFKAMKTALITALTSSSSAITLPVTMRSMRVNVGVSRRMAGFILPIGTTVNMCGSVIYKCVIIYFISQGMGMDFSWGEHALILSAVFIASIAEPPVPSGGVIQMGIFMEMLNVPNADALLVILIAIDRPIDMLVTVVNVFSNSCAVAVVANSEGETLYKENAQYFI